MRKRPIRLLPAVCLLFLCRWRRCQINLSVKYLARCIGEVGCNLDRDRLRRAETYRNGNHSTERHRNHWPQSQTSQRSWNSPQVYCGYQTAPTRTNSAWLYFAVCSSKLKAAGPMPLLLHERKSQSIKSSRLRFLLTDGPPRSIHMAVNRLSGKVEPNCLRNLFFENFSGSV